MESKDGSGALVHAAADLQQADVLVRAAVEAAVSPITKRSYLNAWRQYSQWCEGVGLPAAPILSANVARFLAARAAELDAWGVPRLQGDDLGRRRRSG